MSAAMDNMAREVIRDQVEQMFDRSRSMDTRTRAVAVIGLMVAASEVPEDEAHDMIREGLAALPLIDQIEAMHMLANAATLALTLGVEADMDLSRLFKRPEA